MRPRAIPPFLGTLILVLGLGSNLRAEIGYVATLESLSKLRIEMSVPIQAEETLFRIPNFAPGHYVLLTVAKDVSEVKAIGSNGADVPFEKVDDNTYRVKTPGRGVVRFSYAKPMRPADGALLWQGPYEYMYVVGRKEEPCRLTLRGPEGCRFATALDPAGPPNTFLAPDYDVLADAPVAAGDLLLDEYSVQGKPHHIVLYGAVKGEIDRPYLRDICRRLTETQSRMMGPLPYPRYMWHFRVYDGDSGGGGLEHLNSTNISMASGLGVGNIGLLSHEFFHLWNVKRIRSQPLGPFDYQTIPKTGALWWLEGVTDYYASVLSVRAGLWSLDDFWNDLIQNVRATRRNEQRFQVSPYDSSFRVGEAAGGRGNSSGFGVNYYNTGWVAGLCLDAEIRHRTRGRRSLDDVMRALYELCKDGRPGFEEGEIRAQLVRFGGPEMGPLYDTWILKPGELPAEDQLAKLGYRLSFRTVRRPDLGFTAVVAKANRAMRVSRVREPSQAVLRADDLIVAANGVPCDFPTYRSILQSYRQGLGKIEFGKPARLTVVRGGERLEVTVEPTVVASDDYAIDPILDLSGAFAGPQNGWLSSPK